MFDANGSAASLTRADIDEDGAGRVVAPSVAGHLTSAFQRWALEQICARIPPRRHLLTPWVAEMLIMSKIYITAPLCCTMRYPVLPYREAVTSVHSAALVYCSSARQTITRQSVAARGLIVV